MHITSEQIERLSGLLGYQIKNPDLFAEAFAHPAGPAGNPKKYTKSYERLEFLGDRILGLIVAEALFLHYKTESEGKITKRFIALVRKEMLVRISKTLDLGDYVTQLPENEHNLRYSDTALADVMESFIAAVYLDAGFETVRAFVLSLWTPIMLEQITPPSDAKSILQEWLQAKGLPLPSYKVIDTYGPSNAPTFVVVIEGKGFRPEKGEGKTKKLAEHKAAQAVLVQVKAGV